jgi:predicted enzyme related to lactoylglutathione lyase
VGLARGTIGLADVAAPDMAAAETFCAGLFGWEAQPGESESFTYTMFAKDSKLVAGMGR